MSCFINKNLRYLIDHRSLTIHSVASKIGMPETLLESFINESAIPDVVSAISLSDFFNLPLDVLLKEDLEIKEKTLSSFNFKFLVLDIDGVMTDGGIIYTESGDEIKNFNAKDGLAIIRLTEAGTKVGFLSSGFTKNIIERRAKVLGVQYVYVGTWKKLEILEKWCSELNIDLQNVAYIGDDLNDLAIIEKVGCSACPADASPAVKKTVNIILSAKGGKACVREFVDNYLNS
jgi:3-deoxy-D-manno-octulosonate 8-phosphate phosphatase (KDO 8-P phosphatase)